MKTYSRKAIETKIIPFTETNPKRIKAFDSDGNQIMLSIHSLSFDNLSDLHYKAAKALQDKMDWSGTLIGGDTKQGMTFVFLPDAIEKAIVRAEYWIAKLCEVSPETIAECEKETGMAVPESELIEARRALGHFDS